MIDKSENHRQMLPQKILLIDNFDSFTYNIVETLRKINQQCDIVRYDEFILDIAEHYDNIIISPGPGHPDEYTKHFALLNRYRRRKKILGICLGHQLIAEYYGAELINLPQVRHGIASKLVGINENYHLYRGLAQPIKVGRYHSWAVNNKQFPEMLTITAFSDDNVIMSLAHHTDKVTGVQFHPESIITDQGQLMLRNWLNSD